MRIIKQTVSPFTVIAGEILNIESSTYHYLNGKPLEIGKDIMLSEYKGYPKIKYDTVVDTIKGSAGYIFVPVGTDLVEFERGISAKVLELEKGMIRPDGNDAQVLKGYHTIRNNYNTNIKVQSALNLTRISSDPVQPQPRHNNGQGAGNIKRMFLTDKVLDMRRGRFTWFIKTIDDVEQEITSDNMDDSIARYALSILYDRDNICKHEHNHVTFEFSRKDLKGYDNIVNERVTLFKHGNPLLFELNEHWCNVFINSDASTFLRNINENIVFEHDHATLTFKPVNMTESGETSTDVCSKCRSVLFGENYALVGSIKNRESTECIAICPLCLHSSPEDQPIEEKYFRVLRVKFPRTTEDVLENANVSEDKRDIRREALKKVERKSFWVGDNEINYIIIGDKYVAFDDVNDFLFSSVSINPDFRIRKVCSAQLVE